QAVAILRYVVNGELDGYTDKREAARYLAEKGPGRNGAAGGLFLPRSMSILSNRGRRMRRRGACRNG
ncbi:MAG: hypothetical protein P8Z80_09485, partial [Pseudolabrys sp.]